MLSAKTNAGEMFATHISLENPAFYPFFYAGTGRCFSMAESPCASHLVRAVHRVALFIHWPQSVYTDPQEAFIKVDKSKEPESLATRELSRNGDLGRYHSKPHRELRQWVAQKPKTSTLEDTMQDGGCQVLVMQNLPYSLSGLLVVKIVCHFLRWRVVDHVEHDMAASGPYVR